MRKTKLKPATMPFWQRGMMTVDSVDQRPAPILYVGPIRDFLTDQFEPRLGQGRATILCDYPVAEAALARPKQGDPRVAERFELYACGVELANGFGELTDPIEQRRRFELEMAEKERIYGERYPIDEDFLAALEHGLPDCAGIALGFDRQADRTWNFQRAGY